MITQEYSDFFNGLAANNHKEWFHENKKTYENHAKKPFLALLEQVIPLLKELEPEISPNPKDALFRINRDIRFSKDKTPYHTLLKAGFSPGGKKSFLPGFYLGMSADTIHLGGGLFNLKGPELKEVRGIIAADPETFNGIVNAKTFTEKFGELRGEKAKRLSKDLQEAIEKTPLIVNKQFYAMGELPLKKHLNSDKLPAVVMEYFQEINALNQFLKRAF